ncbi:MAG: LegC family aminotransferase [Syntrophorhabdaceae bacterium]
MYATIVKFIRDLYGKDGFISLHEPQFPGNEKEYLARCIDSTYVSYIGEFVGRFEDLIKEYTGAKHAIATANGTLALHGALQLMNVKPGDEVVTQALTFVATANAVSHCGARPVFIDSDKETMGMSPEILEDFFANETEIKKDGFCYNRRTGRKIASCIPMHVFGHPVKIDQVVNICQKYNVPVVEDSAESLGSFYKDTHTGTFGKIGILSFNGNKIITTGGGGMILTDDDAIAARAKHITATAKMPHKWEFIHDEIGYNYRMPNINAAVGCAQMEYLGKFLESKRDTAKRYEKFFGELGIAFFTEKENCRSNYWLNAMLLKNRKERDDFLAFCHENQVMSRPVWMLMNKLPMYRDCQATDMSNAQWLEDRIVNIPSSVRNIQQTV